MFLYLGALLKEKKTSGLVTPNKAILNSREYKDVRFMFWIMEVNLHLSRSSVLPSSGTNWSVDILRLEDILLQVFLSREEDFRGWNFLMIIDLYNKDVLYYGNINNMNQANKTRGKQTD